MRIPVQDLDRPLAHRISQEMAEGRLVPTPQHDGDGAAPQIWLEHAGKPVLVRYATASCLLVLGHLHIPQINRPLQDTGEFLHIPRIGSHSVEVLADGAGPGRGTRPPTVDAYTQVRWESDQDDVRRFGRAAVTDQIRDTWVVRGRGGFGDVDRTQHAHVARPRGA